MFQIDTYISELIELLKKAYGGRLLYVGLQGSYLRGEAAENSDIDIMAVIEDISVRDLDEYRKAVDSLPDSEKSCGFICGKAELQKWNPMEICHVLHTTKDYFGRLGELVPEYSREDVRNFVKLNLDNLYHEICHRYIHSSREKNEEKISYTYRSVFFILQNLHYLDSGVFINTKRELSQALTGKDRLVLDTAISMGAGETYGFEQAFELLFSWCQETMARVS